MARSPHQSDFVVGPAEPVEAADDGGLPTATVRTTEASAGATRWVLGLTWFMLIALFLLLLIGPHIPAGE